jgi:transposase
MFLRVSTQRRVDGSVIKHLQIAESSWNRAKKRADTRIIHNCGRSDDPEAVERLRRLARSIIRRCSPEEIVADDPAFRLLDAWPFGPAYVLEKIWQRLGIGEVLARVQKEHRFGFSLERALFAMVANRCCAPSSKLYCCEQWLHEDVRIEGTENLELHQLYRAMDFLEANREQIEEEIYWRLSDLLNLDVDLIFYDTTSVHFEIDEEDEGWGEEEIVRGSKQAGGKEYGAARKRGHSKNGRTDAAQIVVGLAVTRDGFPVRHWIFPGNTVDVTTVEKVRQDLRQWKLGRCVFVGDAGMVSEENLKVLGRGGGKYIVAVPTAREKEVAEDVLRRPGRFQKVAENLRVKEVQVGDGERRRRYVVCHNPVEEQRQRLHRERLLYELQNELNSLADADARNHSKRLCGLRSSRRYGRYLGEDANGRVVIDEAKVRAAERLDGRFVLRTNDDTLSSEDLALGYKQLQRVEQAWRSLKSGLRMRPVYHWAVHRVHAHIAIAVLALLVERVIEHGCQDTWRNINDDLRQVKLAHFWTPNGDLWQVTEPRPAASKRLKSLDIQPPPAVLRSA